MIDTITLESRFLKEGEYEMFRGLGKEKSAINNATGKEIYRFVTCNMKNTYHSNIMIQLKDKIWMREPGRKESFQIPSMPYLRIELSLHKFVLGHNVHGGSNDLYMQMVYFLNQLNKWFGSCLQTDDFRVLRIDYAEAFQFSTKKKVSKWIETMSRVRYPRRRRDVFDDETLYFKGTTSTLKFYHKGPEFRKHDRKRLLTLFHPEAVDQLQKEADKLLRIECEVKKKKLKEWFGGECPKVDELVENFDLVINFWEEEVNKVMKIKNDDRKRFETVSGVENYLKACLGDQNGSAVYLTYLKLQMMDEKQVKDCMAERTYYRHTAYLKSHGIDWTEPMVQAIENTGINAEIMDFKADREAPNRCRKDIVSILCLSLEPMERPELYLMSRALQDELVVA